MSVVFLGQLPASGETVERVVHAWGHEKPDDIAETLFVRAESVPLEPK